MIVVAHLLNDLRPSGAERMLAVAGPMWAHRYGIRPLIYSMGNRADSPFHDELVTAGYEIRYVGYEPRRLGWYRELRRQAKADGVTVAHIHAERSSTYTAFALRSMGARVVRTVHSTFLWSGHYRVRRASSRNLLRLIGVRTVAVSKAVQDNERRRFLHPTDLIYNWVDPRFLDGPDNARRVAARKTLGIADDMIVFITVGNCAPVKNHDLMLRALSQIELDRPWTYLHVGDETYAPSDERTLAVELDIAEQVCFLGRREAFDVLPAGDVFAMPSTYEGMGVAAIEAQAMGLRCVFSKIPALQEMAMQSRVLYTPLEPSALARNLENAANEEAVPHLLRLDLLRERFGLAENFARYIEAYGLETASK